MSDSLDVLVPVAKGVRFVGASGKVCQVCWCKWQGVSDSLVQVAKCVRLVGASGKVCQPRWYVSKCVRVVGTSGKVCQRVSACGCVS